MDSVPPKVVADIELLLRDREVVAKPRRHLDLGLRAPNDEWIVASAVAGKTDASVTGDRDILETTVHLRFESIVHVSFGNRATKLGPANGLALTRGRPSAADHLLQRHVIPPRCRPRFAPTAANLARLNHREKGQPGGSHWWLARPLVDTYRRSP